MAIARAIWALVNLAALITALFLAPMWGKALVVSVAIGQWQRDQLFADIMSRLDGFWTEYYNRFLDHD